MKSALIISLVVHVAVGFVWFRLVKISRVRFIPREVYTVSLVTPAAATQPKPVVQKVDPEPVPPQPEPADEEAPDEMPPPPERPKPKPKPKKEK